MTGKTRILHILASLGSGGVEVLLYNYYMAMDRSLIAFDFIVHQPAGMVESLLASEDSRVFHLPRFRRFFANFFQTRRVIKQGGYQIVHVHHTAKSFVQLLAAWSCGVKVRIAHSHDCLFLHGFRLWRFKCYAWLTTLLATDYFSCGVRAGQFVFGSKTRSSSFRLVHNAIHLSRFAFDPQRRADIRGRFHLDNCFVLVNVGRFALQKNHKRLVGVFAHVQKRVPQARLLLLGEGELKEEIRVQVERSGLSDKVLFVGKTADVASFLHAADVFVLPSFHEGFPIVLVEAQAAGLPCVASQNVTDEANLAGLVQYVPLDAPDETWSEAICSMPALDDRSTSQETLRRAGYDLETEALDLQNWYLRKALLLGPIQPVASVEEGET